MGQILGHPEFRSWQHSCQGSCCNSYLSCSKIICSNDQVAIPHQPYSGIHFWYQFAVVYCHLILRYQFNHILVENKHVYSYTASILPSSFLCPYVLNFNCVVSETWVHPFSTTKPTTILSLKVESSCLFNILQLQPSNIFQQSSNFHLKEWITKEYICVQLSPRPNLHFRSFIFFIKLLIIKIPCFSGPFRTVIFK